MKKVLEMAFVMDIQQLEELDIVADSDEMYGKMVEDSKQDFDYT
jgi:hypothetical protein